MWIMGGHNALYFAVSGGQDLITNLFSKHLNRLKKDGLRCAYCGKKEEKLKNCSRCSDASYWSTTCQANDWKKFHKIQCNESAKKVSNSTTSSTSSSSSTTSGNLKAENNSSMASREKENEQDSRSESNKIRDSVTRGEESSQECHKNQCSSSTVNQDVSPAMHDSVTPQANGQKMVCVHCGEKDTSLMESAFWKNASVCSVACQIAALESGPLEKRYCSGCYESDAELSLCTACKKVRYCSSFCQKADWTNHSKQCVTLVK